MSRILLYKYVHNNKNQLKSQFTSSIFSVHKSTPNHSVINTPQAQKPNKNDNHISNNTIHTLPSVNVTLLTQANQITSNTSHFSSQALLPLLLYHFRFSTKEFEFPINNTHLTLHLNLIPSNENKTTTLIPILPPVIILILKYNLTLTTNPHP